MFDQKVRTLAQAFAASCNWLFNFPVARFTPQMFLAMGYGVYMFIASLMIFAAIFVYFLIPETKGISFGPMDRLFSHECAARRAHAIALAEVHEQDRQFCRDSMGGHVDSKAVEADYRYNSSEKDRHVEWV